MRKFVLVAGVCLPALWAPVAMGQPSSAQVPPARQLPDGPAAGRNVGTSSAASVQPEATAGLEDIVVTANKVSANVQKIPVAITAIDGAALVRQGISQVQDVSKLVPGVQIEANASGSASIYIRGVGSRVLSATSDPAVAFSIDGVYLARTAGLNASLFDVSRIEVVKGPQGTLYGRNATGGAVNILSNRPRLGVRSLDGSIEVGNYQDIRATDAINLPIGQEAAVRIAGQVVHRNGYLSDGYNDDVSQSARASILYKPSIFTIFASVDYSHQGGQGIAFTPVGPQTDRGMTTRFAVPGNPYVGPSDPRVNALLNAAAPASAIPGLPGTFCAGVPFSATTGTAAGAPAIPLCSYPLGFAPIANDGRLNNHFAGANLTVDADLGFGQLTAIGGYRKTKVDAQSYATSTKQDQQQDVDQFTGELRLASSGNGRLRWLVGGFYSHEKQDSSLLIPTGNLALPNPVPTPGSSLPATVCAGPLDPDGPGPQPAIPGLCLVQATVIQNRILVRLPDLVDENYAAFGQATYTLVDGLRITGGIRFTHERKQSSNGEIQSFYIAPANLVTSFPSDGNVKFKDTSYRAGVEYDVAPRSMFYAQFSTAFHAGGFNLGVEQGPNTYAYQPEKVKSYTIGIKNRFFDNRLEANIELFWLDYNNYQTQRLGPINDGSAACSQLGIVAACPLTVRTENAAKARSRGVEADVVLKVGDNGRFDANVLYNEAIFRRFQLADTFTGALTDYSGLTLPGASKWSISAGYQQRFPLANGAAIVADARSQYKGKTWMWYIHVPGNYQKAYTRTDLSLGYEAPNDAWSLTAFVRNVENKATLQQGSPPDSITGLALNVLNPPRTFGAILSYHF